MHGRRQFWGGVETHGLKLHAKPVPDLNVACFHGEEGGARHRDPEERANPGRQLLMDICDGGRTLPSLDAGICSRLCGEAKIGGGDDYGGEGALCRGILGANEGARLPLGQLLDLDVHGAHSDGAVVLQGGLELYLPTVPNLESINAAADGYSGK